MFTRLERLYMSENENLGADAVVMGRLPPTLRYVALEGCHLQVGRASDAKSGIGEEDYQPMRSVCRCFPRRGVRISNAEGH